MAARRWESHEVEAIRTLPPGGIPELARRLGRSMDSIAGKRRYENIRVRPSRHWTPAEDAVLREHLTAGPIEKGTWPRVAAALGRAVAGVRARADMLREQEGIDNPRFWTPAEDELIRAVVRQGRARPGTWKRVAAQLGRSLFATWQRAKRIQNETR